MRRRFGVSGCGRRALRVRGSWTGIEVCGCKSRRTAQKVHGENKAVPHGTDGSLLGAHDGSGKLDQKAEAGKISEKCKKQLKISNIKNLGRLSKLTSQNLFTLCHKRLEGLEDEARGTGA